MTYLQNGEPRPQLVGFQHILRAEHLAKSIISKLHVVTKLGFQGDMFICVRVRVCDDVTFLFIPRGESKHVFIEITCIFYQVSFVCQGRNAYLYFYV